MTPTRLRTRFGAALTGVVGFVALVGPEGYSEAKEKAVAQAPRSTAEWTKENTVVAAARRGLATWKHGEHTSDYAAFRAVMAPDFRLFSHPVWRRGIHWGADAREAIEALMASREKEPNALTFSDVTAAQDGDTVVLMFRSAGLIAGKTHFDGHNAIALLMDGEQVAGFREYFGDVPQEWLK